MCEYVAVRPNPQTAPAAAIKQTETPDGAEVPKREMPKREMPNATFNTGCEMHRQVPSFEKIKQAQQSDTAIKSAADYVQGGKVKSNLPSVHPDYQKHADYMHMDHGVS